MSDTNGTKEPGQTLYEAMLRDGWDIARRRWENVIASLRCEWAITERAVLDYYAPRLATLEAETRDLHRKLSESRVEAQAQRAGRVEAEHQRDVLVGRVGREVTAALVAAVPAKVADVLTGAQRIDEAQQKALDDAVTRAERAERERDAMRGALDMLEHERNTARKQRDEAICARDAALVEASECSCESKVQAERAERAEAEVARLTKAAEDAEDAVTGRLDAAFKDGASRMQAEIDRLKAKSTARGQRSRYECVTPAGTLYLDDPDANGVQFREAVRYAFASLTPRPDAGLAGLAEREAVAEVKTERSARWIVLTLCVDGEYRPEIDAFDSREQAERYARDWDYSPDCHKIGRVVIEPPATQAEPRYVVGTDNAKPGSRDYSVEVVMEHGDDGVARMVSRTVTPAAPVEPATQAEPVRPPAPDLRPGDVVKDREGREWSISGSPTFSDVRGDWLVSASSKSSIASAAWASRLDLSTRVRTWQVGEVVPQAPLTVMRDSSTGARAFTASGGINPNLPLAEPWTQTGV